MYTILLVCKEKIINFLTAQRKQTSWYCIVLSANAAIKYTIQIRAGCVVCYSTYTSCQSNQLMSVGSWQLLCFCANININARWTDHKWWKPTIRWPTSQPLPLHSRTLHSDHTEHCDS